MHAACTLSTSGCWVRRNARAPRALLRLPALLVALLIAVLAPAWAAPRIGVVTMQPGEIFFERFGHNAIVVVDAETNDAISYNFGFFDPTEKDFVSRFVKGDMRYRLAALPFEQDLMQYREEGRGVSIQWLDLTPAQAQELADALAENARPENAFYKYEYFDDNCSTRVRDALDRVLDGGLRRQIEGRSHGSTARSEAVRLASPAWWMWLGFDVGLGPSADQPMPVWRESYVPMRLAAALREAKNSEGRPLVMEEQQVLPHRLPPEPQDQPVRWWPWALAGLAVGVAAAWLGRTRPRALAAVALPFWTLAGVLGALMLFLWFGTQHTYAWANANLLLLSPLCWLLVPGAVRAVRGRDAGRFFRGVLAVIALGAVASLFVYWLPVNPQRNVHWIALLLPIHLGLLHAFRRR